MVSSKDILQGKKIATSIRQASKKFFDDFYARAAKAGRHPLPLEAMAALGRTLTRVAEEYEEPPQTPDRQGVSADVFEALLDSNLVQYSYLEAVSAYGRHTPGLEIKKGKPGRPRNDALANEAARLKKAGLSYAQVARHLKVMRNDGAPNGELIRGLLKSRRRKACRAD